MTVLEVILLVVVMVVVLLCVVMILLFSKYMVKSSEVDASIKTLVAQPEEIDPPKTDYLAELHKKQLVAKEEEAIRRKKESSMLPTVKALKTMHALDNIYSVANYIKKN